VRREKQIKRETKIAERQEISKTERKKERDMTENWIGIEILTIRKRVRKQTNEKRRRWEIE
jgi:hypothetical protein